MKTAIIPMKLPSLNDYIRECRANKYSGARMKKQVENDIALFLRTLPRFTKPIIIHFHWVEKNKRRDYDNIAFAKKFILDTLVKIGKLKDDNRNCVTAFTDTFSYGDNWRVILRVEEHEGQNSN